MTRNCIFIEDSTNTESYLQSFTCTACGCKVNAAPNAPPRKTCRFTKTHQERVGSHISRLLERLSIANLPGCKCKSRAKYLDRVGADWCEQNIETIVEWLKEEATARGLPYLSTVGRMLVRRAISNARKEAERAKNTT